MRRTDIALALFLSAACIGTLFLLHATRPARVAGTSVVQPKLTAMASADPAGLSRHAAPVPLHLKHRPAFGSVTVEALIAAAANEPTAATSAPEASAETSTPALPETVDPDAAAARSAAEADGYRNVKVLKRRPDGTWRVSGLRGRTTVLLTVDAGGGVTAD